MTSAFIVAVSLNAGAASAQVVQTFEVASVKPNRSGDVAVRLGNQSGGRFLATNLPVSALIQFAYQIQDFQLVGGPSWISNDRFDIAAKAADNVSLELGSPGGPPGAMQLMLRELLKERFGLVLHEEIRDLPIYRLVLSRADRAPGDSLRRSDIDCAAMLAGRIQGPGPAAPGARPLCNLRVGAGSLVGGAVPLARLTAMLSQTLRRAIADDTGLSGYFDFDLQWTPEQSPSSDPLPPTSDRPSLFTALEEQLGFRLQPGRGPVPVLVIDSVSSLVPD